MVEPCHRFQKGQTFLIGSSGAKAGGLPLRLGMGRHPARRGDDPIRESPALDGEAMPCCTDGFRPVSSLVERIEG